MGEDFDILPLAMAVQDDSGVTIELPHPEQSPPSEFMPIWD